MTLLGALAVACGGSEEPTNPFGGAMGPAVAGTGGTGGTAGVGAAGGGTPGGSQVTTPTTPATTGGTASSGGTVGGSTGGRGTTPATTGGGGGQVTTPGATGGGASADTLWCKVKAITDVKCAVCHTTPAVAGAPFPLKTYQDFVAAHPSKAGKKVYERVGFRVHSDKAATESLTVMPPGVPLPADQIALIDSWVAAGAPDGGNPTCAGAPAAGGSTGGNQAAVEWPLKECDGVYKILAHGSGGASSPYSVPPGQEIHPQVTFDAPWGSEQVQAIGFKAVTDNPAVLHHWILYAPGFIVGWAPGEDGVKPMAPDVGVLLPGGSGSLRLDIHYNSLTQTKAQNDQSGVEVCIVKKAKFRKNSAAVTMGLAGIPIIPGNSKNVSIDSDCTLSGTQSVTLLSASPHAHKLARRMVFTLFRKNGEKVVMHDMPFMFGEQHSYPLDPPVVANPGDRIHTTCIYDNDSNQTVTFGENTGNEMCFNFAMYYPAGALNCGGGLLGGGFGF